jgi:lysophospholipase L1-like esterase
MMRKPNTLLALLAGTLLAASILAGSARPARKADPADDPSPRFVPGAVILFQGDSITDGGRCGARYPDQRWTFLNRGVSGDQVTDLAARWQADTLDLKPDILSVLVGVNDAAGVVNSGGKGGVGVQQYEQTYDRILGQAKAANPALKIVLCEPFTEPTGHVLDNPTLWATEIRARQEAVGRLASKYHAPVVHFQAVLDAAVAHSHQPITYWVWDGIHPTYAGHELMAEEWLRTVSRFYDGPRR